jgi:hypothetical protein
MKQEIWNRCDVCGKFIALNDFETNKAIRKLTTPESECTQEGYETLCTKHSKTK